MSKSRGGSERKEVIDMYLEEIRAIPLLMSEEESKLAQRIKEDRTDQEARDKLVSANTRFAVSVAKLYRDCGLPLGDLIQAGNVGLIKATERFDPGMGFKFISYAVWWIFRSIKELIHEQSRVVRLPINRAQVVAKTNKVLSKLAHDLSREPTPQEIAAAIGNVPPDRIEEAITLLFPPISLDASVTGPDDPGLIGVLESSSLSPEEDALTKLLRCQIHDNWEELTKNLTEREKQVIDLRFHLSHIFNEERPLTLDQVGKRFSLTRERIRQIEKNALRKMRAPLLKNLPAKERALLLKQIRHDKQTRLDKSESKKKRSIAIPLDAAAQLSEDDLITISTRRPAYKAFSRLNQQEIREIHRLVEKIKQKMSHFSNIEWLPFVEYYGLNVQKPKRLDEIGQEIGRHVSVVSVAKDRILRQLAGGERENIDALKSILEVYRYMRLRQKEVQATEAKSL